MWGCRHLSGLEVNLALPRLDLWTSLYPPGFREPPCRGRLQEYRGNHHNRALDDAPNNKGVLIAGARRHSGWVNHSLKRSDGGRRTRTKAGGREARGESAVVGEPFQRAPDCRAVNYAGAEARDRIGKIERAQSLRFATAIPTRSCQDSSNHYEQSWPKGVHQPAFKRDEPGLKQHKYGKGNLDERCFHAQVLLKRTDEESPTILKVGHRNHAEDAKKEDDPAIIEK